MIKAAYNQDKCEVTLKGHAFSGKPGHDLVCAAASALVYTLVANVDNASELFENREITLEPGSAIIKCVPKPECKAAAGYMFDIVCIGLEILAINFPENISYDIYSAGIEKECRPELHS